MVGVRGGPKGQGRQLGRIRRDVGSPGGFGGLRKPKRGPGVGCSLEGVGVLGGFERDGEGWRGSRRALGGSWGSFEGLWGLLGVTEGIWGEQVGGIGDIIGDTMRMGVIGELGIWGRGVGRPMGIFKGVLRGSRWGCVHTGRGGGRAAGPAQACSAPRSVVQGGSAPRSRAGLGVAVGFWGDADIRGSPELAPVPSQGSIPFPQTPTHRTCAPQRQLSHWCPGWPPAGPAHATSLAWGTWGHL